MKHIIRGIEVEVATDPDYPTLIWATYEIDASAESSIHEEIAKEIGFLKPSWHNDFGFWQMSSQKYARLAYDLAGN